MRLVPTEERYPLDPLLDALGLRSLNQAAARIGVSGATLYEYRDRGLTAHVADRLAVKAGLHPAMVWPSWVEDGLTVLDRVWLTEGWRTAWLWREVS